MRSIKKEGLLEENTKNKTKQNKKKKRTKNKKQKQTKQNKNKTKKNTGRARVRDSFGFRIFYEMGEGGIGPYKYS